MESGDEQRSEMGTRFEYSCEEEPFKQGAEAKLYRCVYLGREAVIKERFPKKYRHPSMDELLTKERIKAELRAISKCKQMGVDVPAVFFVHPDKNQFVMERINGITARQFIEDVRNNADFNEVVSGLGRRLGAVIGKMHQNGIMHGDLTSSNVLLRQHDPHQIVLIDFGLSEGNATTESKGVDLYVLEKAINSTHINSTQFLFSSVLHGYKEYNVKQFNTVFKKLEEIRLRGRKRDMVG